MPTGAGAPFVRRYFYALALAAALTLSAILLVSGASSVHASAPSPATTATPQGVKAPASATPTPVAICDHAWYLVGAPEGTFRMLTGVAAVAQNDVWAVGQSLDATGWHAIANHWNGNAWSEVPVPTPGPAGTWSAFYAVSALSSSDIWAVGNSQDSGLTNAQTLVEHWDGSAWTIVASPSVPNTSNMLKAIAAVSPTDVWAAGVSIVNGQTSSSHTLIERWDGANWTIVPDVTLPFNSTLDGIAVVSANQVWAVGSQTDNLGTSQTLVERWDGTAWSVVTSPNVGGTGRLHGITVISPSDIWAVGEYQQNYNINFTLTEHWDGTAWTVVPSPTFGDDYLNAVAAVSANDIWAVGYYGDGPSTLTLHWDGSAWTRTYSPQPVTPYSHDVKGVAAISSGDIWAVGYYANVNQPTQSLVMHYTDSFLDVHPTDYFYDAVRYLYCKGAISGYLDGTYRPFNNMTRVQLAKVIVAAESWPYYPPPQTPTFSDVPSTSPFYYSVETLSTRGVISGYSDHTYRPTNDVTRAQLSKIVVNAQQWPIDTTGGPHFRDVGTDDPFYGYIETAYNRQIITGYDCGAGCLEFRPGWPATRGQLAKIIFNALLQPGRLTNK